MNGSSAISGTPDLNLDPVSRANPKDASHAVAMGHARSNSESDDDNSDHDDSGYRQYRAPSPIPLRTGPLSGMMRNFGADILATNPARDSARDRDLGAFPTTDHVPTTARGGRNLGYGVELGLEFPDVPRFSSTSRPSRVDSAWTTTSKLHLPQDPTHQEHPQSLPTGVDDPLASFAIPMLSSATPASAFAPSPSPLQPATGDHHNSVNADNRIAQLRAAILDVSADQARDHLRSRQLFSQHRPHINSLVQRLFTVHETDPYFVARSLALLAKFDTPYKRQRVLLTLDAMDQEMSKEEERELLGLDDAAAEWRQDWREQQAPSTSKDPSNAYLHSLHAASSAVKDSLHTYPMQSPVRAQQGKSLPSSSSSASGSSRRRGRRGRPNTESERVEPHRFRASIGSAIPLFPGTAVAAQPRLAASNSTSSPSHRSQRASAQGAQRRGRGEDDDSTATCTTVSSSSSSSSCSDQEQADGDRLVDLNSLLLAATNTTGPSSGATAMIRNQLTQERQRLLLEQEQLRDMLAELKRDVSVMERVASLQAQKEKEQMGVEQAEEDEEEEENEEDEEDKDEASESVKEGEDEQVVEHEVCEECGPNEIAKEQEGDDE